MINSVVFDLAEVLLTGIIESGQKLSANHKLDTQIRTSPFLISAVEEYFIGRIHEDEYLDIVLQEYPAIGSIEAIKTYIRDNFVEIEGTRDIITTLKNDGYKLGLLSVHSQEWVEYCEAKFDYHKLFDAISYSYIDGVSKPDIRSYEIILDKLKAKPEETLCIDDSERNIEAAQSIGINGLLFATAEQLNNYLLTILPNYRRV